MILLKQIVWEEMIHLFFFVQPLEKSGFADSWNWYCFSSMGILVASKAGITRLNLFDMVVDGVPTALDTHWEVGLSMGTATSGNTIFQKVHEGSISLQFNH